MVVRSLDAKKNPFQPLEKNEEILGLEVTYLSATRALMYFTNCTIPYIAFVVNLYARYSFTPIKKHQNDFKHILRYLYGTIKIWLFYNGYVRE